jgi:hypothetical protein
MKGTLHQEEITSLNMSMPNTGVPNYTKKNLLGLKAQIDPNTVIVGDFNIPLSPIDRSPRQNINKETSELMDTLDPIDIYRAFHPATVQYTFFSAAHGTFSKNILGHKASLNKFKKIKITPCIISDHNPINLELNSKRYYKKYLSTWRLNNTQLYDQQIIKDIREEIKNFLIF